MFRLRNIVQKVTHKAIEIAVRSILESTGRCYRVKHTSLAKKDKVLDSIKTNLGLLQINTTTHTKKKQTDRQTCRDTENRKRKMMTDAWQMHLKYMCMLSAWHDIIIPCRCPSTRAMSSPMKLLATQNSTLEIVLRWLLNYVHVYSFETTDNCQGNHLDGKVESVLWCHSLQSRV